MCTVGYGNFQRGPSVKSLCKLCGYETYSVIGDAPELTNHGCIGSCSATETSAYEGEISDRYCKPCEANKFRQETPAGFKKCVKSYVSHVQRIQIQSLVVFMKMTANANRGITKQRRKRVS